MDAIKVGTGGSVEFRVVKMSVKVLIIDKLFLDSS